MRTSPTIPAQVAGLVLGLAPGLVSGVAVVVLHQRWGWLLLGLTAATLTVLWFPSGAVRMGFVLGWGLPVLRGALPRPEGDYLVASNGPGWALLIGSALLLLLALATLPRRGRRRDDHEVQTPPT